MATPKTNYCFSYTRSILQKLFGIRICLETLNDENDFESIKKRLEYIEMLQKTSREIALLCHHPVFSSRLQDYKTQCLKD